MDKPITKLCNRCGLDLPSERFGSRWSRRHGKYYLQSRCRECLAADAKERRQENPERAKEIDRSYRQRHPERMREKYHKKHWKNREAECAKMRAYYHANKEAARQRFKRNYEKNKLKWREVTYAWRRANKDKVSRYASTAQDKRRVAVTNSVSHYTTADVWKQYESQAGKCYWCKKALEKSGKGKFQVDHIFPLVRGGSNGIGNICCACPQCNQSKWAKSPLEFAGRLF